MIVHCYGSRPHYLRHAAPVMAALGCHAGVTAKRASQIPDDGNPVLLAGPSDLDHVRKRPVILLEHGAAQRYVGLEHRSWGGPGLDNVGLYLGPRDESVAEFLSRYPDSVGATVGCPALDAHTGRRSANPRPVVAFSWHWAAPAASQVPELRPARDHYTDSMMDIVAELRGLGFDVVGHYHPRHRAMGRWWKAHGVTVCDDWDELLRVVDAVVADNTSALPEAAAVGAGVVFLNAPWFRRDVEHGGRFWEWPHLLGVSVDQPDEVVSGVRAALRKDGEITAELARQFVYGGMWGDGARRAADAILTRYG